MYFRKGGRSAPLLRLWLSFHKPFRSARQTHDRVVLLHTDGSISDVVGSTFLRSPAPVFTAECIGYGKTGRRPERRNQRDWQARVSVGCKPDVKIHPSRADRLCSTLVWGISGQVEGWASSSAFTEWHNCNVFLRWHKWQ